MILIEVQKPSARYNSQRILPRCILPFLLTLLVTLSASAQSPWTAPTITLFSPRLSHLRRSPIRLYMQPRHQRHLDDAEFPQLPISVLPLRILPHARRNHQPVRKPDRLHSRRALE